MKKEIIKKKVLAKLADKKTKTSFTLTMYEKIIKTKPEDILSYLREKFPNEEAAFITWVFDKYDLGTIDFSEDLKSLAHKIANIEFEKGVLGKDIIKRKLSNPTKLKLLGL